MAESMIGFDIEPTTAEQIRFKRSVIVRPNARCPQADFFKKNLIENVDVDAAVKQLIMPIYL